VKGTDAGSADGALWTPRRVPVFRTYRCGVFLQTDVGRDTASERVSAIW